MPDIAFDWFRNQGTGSAVLKKNVTWIYHYLSATGLAQKTLSDCLGLCDGAEAAMLGDDTRYSPHGWAACYDRLSEMPTALAYFKDASPASQIIGFELSRAQLAALDANGQSYVNLRTHPLRFLSDTLFSAQSNDPAIHERLVTLAPKRSYVMGHVAIKKAAASARPVRSIDPSTTGVFFGQTALDASRIHDGALVDDAFVARAIQSYMARVGLDHLLYKEHPHQPLESGLRRFLDRMGATPCDANSYDLLSIPDLKVCSLSSSLCYEARFFGANPDSFLQPSETFPIGDEPSKPGDNILMPANLYEPEVWDYLLNAGPMPDTYFPRPATPFSTASGIDWKTP